MKINKYLLDILRTAITVVSCVLGAIFGIVNLVHALFDGNYLLATTYVIICYFPIRMILMYIDLSLALISTNKPSAPAPKHVNMVVFNMVQPEQTHQKVVKEYNLDGILDKINESGIDSLSADEKEFLKKNS